jgi:hypothetical protein
MAQDDASPASGSGIEATGQTTATNAGGAPGIRAVPLEGVEHLLPACGVHSRGVRQDAVEVEQDCIELPP